MVKMQMIGTDAEQFVIKDGKVGSAIDKIGGSKNAPRLVERGNLQEDNILAEFAIDPAPTAQMFVQNISVVQTQLEEVMRLQGYGLLCESSQQLEKEDLLSFGPMAMEMGCTPDFNVYTRRDNVKPCALTRLRTAAAHVHFSYEHPVYSYTEKVVKCMDYCLGLWSLLEDKDTMRREMYGRAGDIRIKDYGGEYRTLGNFWLKSQAMQERVFNYTAVCVERADELLPLFNSILSEQRVVDAINNYTTLVARSHYPTIESIMETMVSEYTNRDVA